MREEKRGAVGLQRELPTSSAQHHLIFDLFSVGTQLGLAAGVLGGLGAAAGEDHVELLAAGGLAGLKPVLDGTYGHAVVLVVAVVAERQPEAGGGGEVRQRTAVEVHGVLGAPRRAAPVRASWQGMG